MKKNTIILAALAAGALLLLSNQAKAKPANAYGGATPTRNGIYGTGIQNAGTGIYGAGFGYPNTAAGRRAAAQQNLMLNTAAQQGAGLGSAINTIGSLFGKIGLNDLISGGGWGGGSVVDSAASVIGGATAGQTAAELAASNAIGSWNELAASEVADGLLSTGAGDAALSAFPVVAGAAAVDSYVFDGQFGQTIVGGVNDIGDSISNLVGGFW